MGVGGRDQVVSGVTRGGTSGHMEEGGWPGACGNGQTATCGMREGGKEDVDGWRWSVTDVVNHRWGRQTGGRM